MSCNKVINLLEREFKTAYKELHKASDALCRIERTLKEFRAAYGGTIKYESEFRAWANQCGVSEFSMNDFWVSQGLDPDDPYGSADGAKIPQSYSGRVSAFSKLKKLNLFHKVNDRKGNEVKYEMTSCGAKPTE